MKEREKVQTFEDFLNEGYEELNIFNKVLYHLQDHVIMLIIICIASGYLAGTYFGKFW